VPLKRPQNYIFLFRTNCSYYFQTSPVSTNLVIEPWRQTFFAKLEAPSVRSTVVSTLSKAFGWLFLKLLSRSKSVMLGQSNALERAVSITSWIYKDSTIQPPSFDVTNEEVMNTFLNLPIAYLLYLSAGETDETDIDLTYLHDENSSFVSQGVRIRVRTPRSGNCTRRSVCGIQLNGEHEYGLSEKQLKAGLIALNSSLNFHHLRSTHIMNTLVAALVLNNTKAHSPLNRLLTPFVQDAFLLNELSTLVLTSSGGVAESALNRDYERVGLFMDTFLSGYNVADEMRSMYLLDDHREVVSIYVDLIGSFDCLSNLNMEGLRSDLVRYGIAGSIGNDPAELIAYIMYSESILHHEMNSYFSLVPFMIGNLSEDGTFTISQYEFDVGFSTAYRANQIPSLITDDFSTLYREHGLELQFFQRRIKLWLFSRRLWNFISHTGIPRSAYG
jgi:hypothetical protein